MGGGGEGQEREIGGRSQGTSRGHGHPCAKTGQSENGRNGAEGDGDGQCSGQALELVILLDLLLFGDMKKI